MGAMLARQKWQIKTLAALEAVFEERVRQEARYGEANAARGSRDGTGPQLDSWIPIADPDVLDALEIEGELRADYERFEAKHGYVTWMHLIREEIAEAFAESDPTRLEEELIQVAALVVAWLENLQSRPSPEGATS